jgi:hypothetical protein
LHAGAAAGVLADACYVRAETAPAAQAMPGEAGSARSHLGLRRKATRLVEVDLLVVQGAAQCTVSGIAKVRGADGNEFLVLPVRSGAPGAGGAPLCLVHFRATPTAIEVTATQAECQALGLCGGQVQLHSQRFDLTNRLPPGRASPCFAHRPA